MILKKKTLKRGRGAKVLHTYRQTYRPSDEAGPRGAFAPKNDESPEGKILK